MPTALDELFNNVPQLPSLPRVVSDLIQSLGDDNADLGGIAEKLRHDPNLSARVLRLANSSHYGARRTIGAIDDAIAIVGLDTLRTLIIATGVTGAFKSVPNLDLGEFWSNALVVAGLARQIARQSSHVNREFAYTAGLMHRIGVLLLHAGFPDGAAKVARNCNDITIGERAAIERTVLRVTHAEVGERLARHWNFPDEIATALRWYAEPSHDKANDCARVVMLAAQIALDHGRGDSDDAVAAGLPGGVMDALEVPLDGVPEIIAAIESLKADAASFL